MKKPTVKQQLLRFLSIKEYFEARKNIREYNPHLLNTEASDQIENPIGYSFNWSRTSQGVNYWGERSDRTQPIKNNWVQWLIKKIIGWTPFIMLIIVLISCKKNGVEPYKSITYSIECSDCVISMENNKFNSGNALGQAHSQYINVNGSFEYTFKTNTLDSVKLTVYVDALNTKQYVKAVIHDNNGKFCNISGFYGFDELNDYVLERTGVLKIR